MKFPARTCFPSALLLACLAVALFIHCSPHSAKDKAVADLLLVKQQVEQQLKNRMDGLAGQMTAFSKVVAGDRDFSMYVLVEKDLSAPEVTGIAPRYMEPMALSLLSLVNSRGTLLSCGHFPASAGGPAPVAPLLDDTPAFVSDNVRGTTVLTLQARARFTILDTVFFATGGVIVDENFCARFSVPIGYRLLCKQGGLVTGMQQVESISDIKDNVIVLNNKSYPAVSVPLPYVGSGAAPELLIMVEKPL